MKKNLLKWMMAIAIVATPMVFTACGSDDDDNSNSGNNNDSESQAQAYSYGFSISATSGQDKQGFQQASAAVQTAMITDLYRAFGKTYDASNALVGMSLLSFITDESKALNTLDATYARTKDTDMKGGYLVMTLTKDSKTLKSYVFGTMPKVGKRDTITFENQTLNDQKYWIGDAVGTYTYKEKGATVTGTQTEYNNEKYWFGFAISGRTENTFTNLNPDQYNSVEGGTHWGEKFLIVQRPYYDYECIEFDTPIKVLAMRVCNSAYAYNSMKNGDDHAGAPFAKEDSLICIVSLYNTNGLIVGEKTIVLADPKYSPTSSVKYANEWYSTRIQVADVKKMSFAFKGSRNNNMGLLTPAYMCVDNIIIEYPAE